MRETQPFCKSVQELEKSYQSESPSVVLLDPVCLASVTPPSIFMVNINGANLYLIPGVLITSSEKRKVAALSLSTQKRDTVVSMTSSSLSMEDITCVI